MTTSAARTALSSNALSADVAGCPESNAPSIGSTIGALLRNALGMSVHTAQLHCLNEIITEIAFEGGTIESVAQSLRDSAATVLDSFDGFFFVLNRDGMLDFVSSKASTYLNYRSVEMMHQSIFNYVSPADHDLFSRLLPDEFCLEDGRKVGVYDSFLCRFLPQRGPTNTPRDIYLQVSAVIISEPNGYVNNDWSCLESPQHNGECISCC
uniref:PAS domain-containing protein n=1 Tax=Parascaris univalens TaxID=6257 RepID=A0A914ZJ52_PARUN